MIAAIVTMLTGAIGPLFTWLTTRDDAKRDEALAQIAAYVEMYKAQTQFKITQWGWWGTRYLLAWAAFGPIWHWTQVFFDSSRWVPTILWSHGWVSLPYPWIIDHTIGSWKVPPAPGDYASYESTVILSFFAVGVAGSALSGILKGIGHSQQMQTRRAEIASAERVTLEKHRMDRDHELRMAKLQFVMRPSPEKATTTTTTETERKS